MYLDLSKYKTICLKEHNISKGFIYQHQLQDQDRLPSVEKIIDIKNYFVNAVVPFVLNEWLTLTLKNASCEQYRISQAVIKLTPPPIQALWTAAITGLSHNSIDEIEFWNDFIIYKQLINNS